jgi:hypothetical protein
MCKVGRANYISPFPEAQSRCPTGAYVGAEPRRGGPPLHCPLKLWQCSKFLPAGVSKLKVWTRLGRSRPPTGYYCQIILPCHPRPVNFFSSSFHPRHSLSFTALYNAPNRVLAKWAGSNTTRSSSRPAAPILTVGFDQAEQARLGMVWDENIDNISTNTKYRKTAVLLLSWKDSDLDTTEEVDKASHSCLQDLFANKLDM